MFAPRSEALFHSVPIAALYIAHRESWKGVAIGAFCSSA